MKINRGSFVKVSIVISIMIIYTLVIAMLDYPTFFNNSNVILALIISAYMLYVVRRRADLLIVMLCILYENYSVVVGCYLDPSIRPAWMYRQFTDMRAYGVAALSLLWFEICLLISYQLFRNIINDKQLEIKAFQKNSLIMYFCILAYLICFISQVNFYSDARASSNVINEYKFIF